MAPWLVPTKPKTATVDRMKPASMKIPALATIYLDNERIGLMGDPQPPVSKIVAASGKRPAAVQILRGLSPTDLRGKPLRPEDLIDRTSEPTRPIYLTSKPHPAPLPEPEAEWDP